MNMLKIRFWLKLQAEKRRARREKKEQMDWVLQKVAHAVEGDKTIICNSSQETRIIHTVLSELDISHSEDHHGAFYRIKIFD